MKKEKMGESSIKIGDGNKFEGDTAIGDGAKIIKDSVVIDNSQNSKTTSYKTKIRDETLYKKISPALIEKYGRKKIGITGIISLIAGIITIVSGIKSLMPSTTKGFNIIIIDIIPAFQQNYGLWICGFGVIIFFIGMILISILDYHEFTRCEECKRNFAYEEVGTPHVEETKTRWGYNEVTTRKYKCRYCGHITERESIREFPDE